MNPDDIVEENETVADDTASDSTGEDRSYDTLDDAVQALMAAETDETEDEPEDDGEAEEVDDTDEAETDDEDGEDEEEVEDDPELTLPDGTVIPQSEALKGFMRDRDYRAKTAELAEQRRTVEAKTKQLDEVGQVAIQRLQEAEALVNELIVPEPSYALAQTNPQQYQQDLALHRESLKLIQGVRQKSQQYAAMVQQQAKQQREEHQRELLKALPALSDPAAMQQFKTTVSSTAAKYGFTDQEIAETSDPRILRMVADLGARMVKAGNAKAAKKRIQRAKPAAGKPKVGTTDARARNLERLRQSGSVDDAVRALMSK